LALGLDVGRGAVERRADGARQERAVVVGIVPGKPAFVMGLLPECRHELDAVDGRLAVQHHGLAVLLHLLAAPGPQIRIAEGRRVAERVTERLADRTALRLELLAGFAVFLPGLRE